MTRRTHGSHNYQGLISMKNIVAMILIFSSLSSFVLAQYSPYTPVPPPDFKATGDQIIAGLQLLADQQRAEEQKRRQNAQRTIETMRANQAAEREYQEQLIYREREERAADLEAANLYIELRRKEQELRLLELQVRQKELEAGQKRMGY